MDLLLYARYRRLLYARYRRLLYARYRRGGGKDLTAHLVYETTTTTAALRLLHP